MAAWLDSGEYPLGGCRGLTSVSSHGGKNGITGSHDYFTFSFLGNLHTVSHSDFTNLHSHLKHHQEYIAVISKVDNTLKFVLSSFTLRRNEFTEASGIYTQLQISFMMTPCISPDSQSLVVNSESDAASISLSSASSLSSGIIAHHNEGDVFAPRFCANGGNGVSFIFHISSPILFQLLTRPTYKWHTSVATCKRHQILVSYIRNFEREKKEAVWGHFWEKL